MGGPKTSIGASLESSSRAELKALQQRAEHIEALLGAVAGNAMGGILLVLFVLFACLLACFV